MYSFISKWKQICVYLPFSLSLSLLYSLSSVYPVRFSHPHIIHHLASNLMNKSTMCHVYLYVLVLKAFFSSNSKYPKNQSQKKKRKCFVQFRNRFISRCCFRVLGLFPFNFGFVFTMYYPSHRLCKAIVYFVYDVDFACWMLNRIQSLNKRVVKQIRK